MARNDVYLYTNATDPADAVITAQQTTTAATFPTLVLGDTPEFNFYFTDGTASWPDFAGDAAYSVTWALSDAIAGDEAPFALQTASTPITGGWSIRLPLNTGRLINALQAKKVSQAWPVVQLWQHIRVTDASGYVVSYAMIRTNVRLRAIGETQVTPDDPLPAGTQYVLADANGAVSSPANFFAASGYPTLAAANVFTNTTQSTSSATGGMTLAGGLGVAKRFNAGNQIGAIGSDTGIRYNASGTITGATTSYGFLDQGIVGAGVTASYQSHVASSTTASSLALAEYLGFRVNNPTLGSGSTITTIRGFEVADITSHTTNAQAYRGAVSSGSGKYNLYMDGTAQNYLQGNSGFGKLPTTTSPMCASGLPTSSAGLATGDFWNDAGTLKIKV